MLIADAEIAAEIKRSTRTLARWDAGKKGTPKGWPQAVYLGRMKYRRSEDWEAFRNSLGGKPATGGESAKDAAASEGAAA